MNKDQTEMWDLLSNNAEGLCHIWADHILRNKRKIQSRADHYLGVMIHQLTVEDMTAIVATWLNKYNIPLDPNKLKNFDAFHEKCGNYIISLSNQKVKSKIYF